MAPCEELYGRICQSLICWREVGERSSTGSDLIRDTSEKVELIPSLLKTDIRAMPTDGNDLWSLRWESMSS